MSVANIETPDAETCSEIGTTLGRPSSVPQSVFWSPDQSTGAMPEVPPLRDAQPEREK